VPARHWWLTSVIPATQEAEIRRIVFQSQPEQTVLKTLSQKKPFHKKGLWSGSKCRLPSSNPSTAKKKKVRAHSTCFSLIFYGAGDGTHKS
jgi:hypothetical protein